MPHWSHALQAERRRKLGLPAEDLAAAKPSAPPPVEEKKVLYAIPSLFSHLYLCLLPSCHLMSSYTFRVMYL